MIDSSRNGPKVHPAAREVLPDDPMNLHAVQVPGDPELMLAILVEEYARMGWSRQSMIELARDPFYQAWHGLWQLYGEEEFRRRVDEILSRCGIMRTTDCEAPAEDELVQLDISM